MKRLLTLFALVKSDTLMLYRSLADHRVHWKFKLLIMGMIIYVVTPLDIWTDVIPLLGQVDDALVIVSVVTWIKRNLPPQLLEEWSGKVKEGK